jgi:hypothetical protein
MASSGAKPDPSRSSPVRRFLAHALTIGPVGPLSGGNSRFPLAPRAHVAAGLDPFIVLLGQDRADGADDGVRPGKMPTTSVRLHTPLFSRFWGLLLQIWPQKS